MNGRDTRHDSAPLVGSRWLGLGLAVALIPYAALALFACPGADDLTYALDTRRDGLWQALRDQYVLWNGRYTSNLLELTGPMVWESVTLYRAVTLLIIATTVAAAYFAVRNIGGTTITRSGAIVAALALAGLDLVGMPSLADMYWYTSYATYQLSALMVITQVGLFVRACSPDRPFQRTMLGVAALLLVAVVGMNEVAMLMTLVFYAVVCGVAMLEGRRRLVRVSGTMLILAACAAVLVFAAPGNAVRSAMYPVRHDLLRSLALAAVQTVRFVAGWSTSGPLLLASILYLPQAPRVAEAEPFRTIRPLGAIALAVCAVALIPMATFPPYWATGLLGQHRTLDVAYPLFLFAWFATLTAFTRLGWLPSLSGGRAVLVACAGLLCMGIALTQNGYGVLLDFGYDRPQAFAREMAGRARTLERCRAERAAACDVPALLAVPQSLFVLEISEDPNDWINRAYASYYEVGTVRRVGPAVASPPPINVRH